jgi:predicted acetyltransferase
MKTFLQQIKIKEKNILEKMLETYLIEMDSNSDGKYKYIDSYWTDSSRKAFFINSNNEIGGFALINKHCILNDSGNSVAEFYIKENYRGKGIGKNAAFQVFDQSIGNWEVRQKDFNKAGKIFWEKIIGEYTNNNFKVTNLDNELWKGQIIHFLK